MTLNDERIGAYLDGELLPEERAEVERALAENNGAAARLERLRSTDALVRSAMRAPPAENETDVLLRKALGWAAANDPIAQFVLNDTPPPRRELWVRRAAAIAAACLIGVLAGRMAAPEGFVASDMRLGSQIARVLDRAPSGDVTPVARGEMRVALSFRTESGDFCRQFRSENGQGASDAIACRDGGGAWRLIAQAATQAATGYQTASGGADPIAATAESLGAMVLSDSEERALIAGHWRAAH